jgi:hypothetical protein
VGVLRFVAERVSNPARDARHSLAERSRRRLGVGSRRGDDDPPSRNEASDGRMLAARYPEDRVPERRHRRHTIRERRKRVSAVLSHQEHDAVGRREIVVLERARAADGLAMRANRRLREAHRFGARYHGVGQRCRGGSVAEHQYQNFRHLQNSGFPEESNERSA